MAARAGVEPTTLRL